MADIGGPVLRHLAHSLFFRHTGLQNVVVLEVNVFHGSGSYHFKIFENLFQHLRLLLRNCDQSPSCT